MGVYTINLCYTYTHVHPDFLVIKFIISKIIMSNAEVMDGFFSENTQSNLRQLRNADAKSDSIINIFSLLIIINSTLGFLQHMLPPS